MKFTKVLTLVFLCLFISSSIYSQSLSYSPAEFLYNDAQKKVLDKAEKFVNRADKLISQADDIEAKYAKLKTKKKKKKKYDKKTWEAKKFKIEAEKNYLKAYEEAITVYSEIVIASEFFDENDLSEAYSLNDDAVESIENAEKKMSSYNKMTSDKKALQKLSSSSLNSAISSASNLRNGAFDNETEALDIVLSQGRKKEQKERDDNAWSNAQSINTIESYQDYIDNFPTGNYVSSANQMIRQLKKEEEDRNRNLNTSEYIFMVQISASKTTLSNYVLSSLYSNTSEINRVYTDYYYKYRVGNFNSYKDAAGLRDRLLRSSVPDAFIVVFDKDGNQIEVTDQMKY